MLAQWNSNTESRGREEKCNTASTSTQAIWNHTVIKTWLKQVQEPSTEELPEGPFETLLMFIICGIHMGVSWFLRGGRGCTLWINYFVWRQIRMWAILFSVYLSSSLAGTSLTVLKMCFTKSSKLSSVYYTQTLVTEFASNKTKPNLQVVCEISNFGWSFSPFMHNCYSHRVQFFSYGIYFHCTVSHQKCQTHSQSCITFGLCSLTFASRGLQFRICTLLLESKTTLLYFSQILTLFLPDVFV